jgi:hypothetical protein
VLQSTFLFNAGVEVTRHYRGDYLRMAKAVAQAIAKIRALTG